jgi:aminomethyltransferase
MPRETAFHNKTAVINESYLWQEWAGYLAAQMYELDHMHEYHAVRTACGLFDVSPLYKYHIHGRDAADLLDRIITRDVHKLKVGQVYYTPWCDDDGKLIDDGTLTRLDENFYRLTAADPTAAWLEDNAFGLDVTIEDVTDEVAALSIQGPTARDVLQAVGDVDLRPSVSPLPFFHATQTTLAGMPVTITRTGYTGDLGYEIWLEPDHAGRLWDELVLAGRPYKLRPTGMVALDMARIEAGLILTDVDFISAKKTMFAVQKSSPYEVGLAWTVKLDKPYFVGQEALRREKAQGSKEQLVGLMVDVVALEQLYGRFQMPLHLPYQSWNDGRPVYADSGQHKWIGKATSGTWSPILKQYIALARVQSAYARPGTRLYLEETIESHRLPAPAVVVKLPFYEPPRKRE